MLRMVERSQHLRLTFESGHAIGVVREGRRQNLDRYLAVEFRIPGAVNLAHAADAYERKDLVGTQATPRGKGHKDVGTILLLAPPPNLCDPILSGRSCETPCPSAILPSAGPPCQ